MPVNNIPLLDILRGVGRSGRTLLNALGRAGRTGHNVYTYAMSEIPGHLSGTGQGRAFGQAIPAMASRFYRQGGLGALSTLGLAATTAYGGKKLYDAARDKYDALRPAPRPMTPYQHVF